MDNNNNNTPDGFDFPNSSSGNNDQLITKEMLDSLRDAATAPKRANGLVRRPGNSAPEVSFPQESSIDMPSEVSGDTIPVGNIRNEVSFPDSSDDAFGPVRKPTHVKIKDEADNDGFKDVKSRKKKLRKRIILGVIFGIVGIAIGIVGFLMWYKHYLYTRMQHVEAPVTIVDESGNTVKIADITQPTQHEIISEDHIHNFLLIGIDTRSAGIDSWGNSDVNMVMSVDDQAGTIKMVSIARDSYAYVPGYSNPMKINAAMAYGGPELLKATVEGCLRLEIDGYAFVNFYNLANVIDAVGGVYIDVTSSEVYGDHGLNMCLDELGYDCFVNQTGYIWVNGKQAVAYGRIRYIGNGDYERSERQVEVLRSMMDQFMAMDALGKASAVDDILSMIATDITEDEVTDYVVNFLPQMPNAEIQYMQLPIVDPDNSSNSCFNVVNGSEWSIRPNWNAQIPFVHEFFYGEQTEFDPVEDIPGSPDISSCPTPDTLPIESLLK